MSHESPLQQESCLASAAPALVVSPSFFIAHEPLLQQHDSIEQQLSADFFWSPCAGVWAMLTANATSSNPSSMIRMVCFRGFILVLLLSKDLCLACAMHTPPHDKR